MTEVSFTVDLKSTRLRQRDQLGSCEVVQRKANGGLGYGNNTWIQRRYQIKKIFRESSELGC